MLAIASDNPPVRVRAPDGNGQRKCWILGVHLVNRDRDRGGFHERMLLEDDMEAA